MATTAAKINKINQTVLGRLMMNEKSTSDININNDSNLIAIYASPYSIKDDDIVNFIGDYNLLDELGLKTVPVIATNRQPKSRFLKQLNADIEALINEIPEFDTLDSAKSKINEFIS